MTSTATTTAATTAAQAHPAPRLSGPLRVDPRVPTDIPAGPSAFVPIPDAIASDDAAQSHNLPGRPGQHAAPGLLVRSAVPRDAAEICRIVNAWAGEGLTIRRDESEIEQAIAEFVVVERERRMLATTALVVFSPSLAEIRSVAAAPEARGTGAASAAVQYVIDQAVAMELDRLVLLTKIPTYFARFAFRTIQPADLPEEFVAEFITARRRTLLNRTIMERVLL